MPQSKGNANWMTNPRKIVDEKNVRVDNSNAYLKNDDLEQGLQVALDAIHIQQRRVMFEREDDIKAVKQSVKTMSAMQRFMKLNKAKQAFEASLIDRKKLYDEIVADQNNANKAQNDKTSTFHKSNTSGFSQVNLNDSDDDLEFSRSTRVKFRRARTKSAHPKLHSYTNRTHDANDDAFAKPLFAGRPKSSFIPSSHHRSPTPSTTTRRSRSPSRKTLPNRPKTTMSIRSSIAREFNSAGPTPRFEAKLAGRSFHELKGLTDFDAVKATEHNAKRTEVLEKRAQERQRDDVRLKERIHSFYADLDIFKRRTSENLSD